MPEPAQRLISDLVAAGYRLYLWKGTEVIAGAMLLIGWRAPPQP